MNAELIESVVSSKTERDCPSDSNGSGHKTNRYSREKRSIYSGLESPKQRLARLSKQRIWNRKNRAQKTEEEKSCNEMYSTRKCEKGEQASRPTKSFGG